MNHSYERYDTPAGYIQVTRDDTDETQELRINAYGKDGTLIKSARYLYNIKYDYVRKQVWKRSVLMQDTLTRTMGYGHLQYEDVYGPPIFDDEYPNPFPDNFEPLNPKGTFMFRHHGEMSSFFCVELDTAIDVNFYVWDDLDENRKPGMHLITTPRKISRYPGELEARAEEELKTLRDFSPHQARRERLRMLETNTQYLRCEHEPTKYRDAVWKNHRNDVDVIIPKDPRFID